MDLLQYKFPLCFLSPPTSPPTLDAPQLPDSPESSRSVEGIALSNGSSEVHIVVDLSNTPKVVDFSSDDELMEDVEEDPEEDPQLGEHKLDHDIEDVELSASNSSFDSGDYDASTD